MKLWDKGVQVNKLIENFTVGKDRELDHFLAEYDILGSMAHITMLESIGLLTKQELKELTAALKDIYRTAKNGDFTIEDGIEDVHSQVELLLTRRLGDVGKKIHSGRSRNDQVLLDIKLYIRAQLKKIVEETSELFETLVEQAARYKNDLMPGYTHLQIAMPSSFGLWFGAYAESLTDDLLLLLSTYRIADQNPLGSAAGYGSSFPLNRKMTTQLLGFEDLNYNVVYAQMGRGKTERIVAFALSSIAATLSKLAYDVCLYMSQNFNFVSLPDELTTGSSIMPHKKNPDVFELIRSHCNRIQGIPAQIIMMTNNLPSGYFRDLQLVKEIFFPIFQELSDCINITNFALKNITIKKDILNNELYNYIYSVEDVNRQVLQGTPFRDAYRNIGISINEGNYTPTREVHHTHEGSIGNLCLNEIKNKHHHIIQQFNFNRVETAINQLIKE